MIQSARIEQSPLPKIFAAGISTETNTFSPVLTGREDFFVQRGADALVGRVDHPALDLSNPWAQQAAEHGYEFVFGFMAWAKPSGLTVRSAYEELRDELLSDLRAQLPVDIVLLMLHGAMVAQGYDDCEEDMIRRVRQLVGPAAVIGVEFDLHCHLSAAKIAAADIVLTYKEYPHVDVLTCARQLFDLAVATRLGHIRPRMALFDCRMVGLYPTSRQPLRGFVDAMLAAERRAGVLAVSFGHGFQFADVKHLGSKVLVVADRDSMQAEEVAREFGLKAYALRREIGFHSIALSLNDALSKALASTRTPVVVADQSDNTGGGAPGDATFALQWLLDQQVGNAALAIFYDPEVVRIAAKAGAGARLAVRLGGKMGPASGRPVDLDVTVTAVRMNYLHEFPQQSGESLWYSAGDVAALRCGGIDIVVSSKRCQVFAPSIFYDLGIDAVARRILVVKSAQHFHGAFAHIAAAVIYMSAPGAVAPDPRLVPYRRLDTRLMYPWVDDPLSLGDARRRATQEALPK